MDEKSTKMHEKWGQEALGMGWTAIPTTLIFLQDQLKITPLGMNILLNLVAHWWDANEKPYPAQESLASRMGVSKRSIQRELNSLIGQGLISKKQSSTSHPKYRGRNSYDLAPLVKMLKEFSPSLVAAMKKKRPATVKEVTDDRKRKSPTDVHDERGEG